MPTQPEIVQLRGVAQLRHEDMSSCPDARSRTTLRRDFRALRLERLDPCRGWSAAGRLAVEHGDRKQVVELLVGECIEARGEELTTAFGDHRMFERPTLRCGQVRDAVIGILPYPLLRPGLEIGTADAPVVKKR